MNEAEIRRGLLAVLLLKIYASEAVTPKRIQIKAIGDAFALLCVEAARRGLLTEDRIPRGYRSERPTELSYALSGGWFKQPTGDVADFWSKNFDQYAPKRVARLHEIIGDDRKVLAEELSRDAYQTYLTLLSNGASV
jgi:hypothetical protein